MKERQYQVQQPSKSETYNDDGSKDKYKHAIVSVTTDPAEDNKFGSYYVLFSNRIVVCYLLSQVTSLWELEVELGGGGFTQWYSIYFMEDLECLVCASTAGIYTLDSSTRMWNVEVLSIKPTTRPYACS